MYDYNEIATSDKITCREEKLTDLPTNGEIYKKVIMQYTDGVWSTGYTNDFYPHIPFFHLFQSPDTSIDKGIKIFLDDLKVIFFDQYSKETISHDNQRLPADKGNAHDKVEIVFKDGEILTGTRIDYRPNSFGFFLLTELKTGLMKVFAISSAMRTIRDLS